MENRKNLKDRRQKRLIATPHIIRALFKNAKGKEASLNFIREGHNLGTLSRSDLSFTYGEIVSASFQQILGFVATSNAMNNFDTTDSTSARVFYDLGCGTGRAVICAALSHQFTKVVGIELVPELVSIAINVKDCLVKACGDFSDDIITEAPALEVTKSKSKQEATPLSHSKLIEMIRSIISLYASSPEGFCSQQVICNELIKQLGSKLYRISIQPFRKFSKFIENSKEHFMVSADDDIRNITVNCSEKQYTSLDAMTEADNAEELSRADEGPHGYNSDSKFVLDDSNRMCCAESCFDGDGIFDTTALANSMKKSASVDLNEAYEESIRAVVSIVRDRKTPGVLEALTPLPEIEFILNNIFDYRWYDDAHVVYAASLLFSDEMMRQLTDQALKMKQGSWIISLKPLLLTTCEGAPKIVLREKSFHKMSWQMAEVFIYQVVT